MHLNRWVPHGAKQMSRIRDRRSNFTDWFIARVCAQSADKTRLTQQPTTSVMGKLFKEGAKGKEKNFRRANIIY